MSVLTSPLPVCLSDGGHARPCDPSDLIRCRKYVKSQKARGGTGTPVHTRHRHSAEYNEETKEVKRRTKRREASGFLFHSCLLLVNYYIYFNNISANARQVIFRYTLVVQHLAPTAVTRY